MTPVRFAFDPVARALGIDLHRPGGNREGDPMRGLPFVAEQCSVSLSTVKRWLRDGIPEQDADRVACSVLGSHPMLVWPQYAAVSDALVRHHEAFDDVSLCCRVLRGIDGLNRGELGQLVGATWRDVVAWEHRKRLPDADQIDLVRKLHDDAVATATVRQMVRAVCAGEGISQGQLARMLGVAECSVHAWVKGATPRLRQQRRLQVCFDAWCSGETVAGRDWSNDTALLPGDLMLADTEIGAMCVALRRFGGLTQGQLGDRLGVSGAAVGYWEKGSYRPKPEIAAVIRHRYGQLVATSRPSAIGVVPRSPVPGAERARVMAMVLDVRRALEATHAELAEMLGVGTELALAWEHRGDAPPAHVLAELQDLHAGMVAERNELSDAA